jgi:DNA polymerase-1
MTPRLLIVDGSNILLRCAFGGDIEPSRSTPMAVGLIERAARESRATHLVVALDAPGVPTWRKVEYPEYKAHRTLDTAPWLMAGVSAFAAKRWRVEMLAGFEADDVIASLALRVVDRASVFALSNDSDLLPLIGQGVQVMQPVDGGTFHLVIEADVRAKYRIRSAAQLVDYKAMVGEPGDNVPGVPRIGARRASVLLERFDDLEAIIAEGGMNRDAARVAEHAEIARLSRRLVALRIDAPVPLLNPRECAFAA